jgi:hypothetical protein
MSQLQLHLEKFLGFWSDFLIGDDWTLAAGVVVVLALVSALNRSDGALHPLAWMVAPVGVLLVLTVSVGRAVLSSRKTP